LLLCTTRHELRRGSHQDRFSSSLSRDRAGLMVTEITGHPPVLELRGLFYQTEAKVDQWAINHTNVLSYFRI